MTRYLLDTGIASDYINRKNNVYDYARRKVTLGHVLGISVTVLSELISGIENSQTRQENMDLFHRHRTHFRIWSFEYDAAWECGRIQNYLRRNGLPIPYSDITIASVALVLRNTVVVTKDQHFQRVPNLTIENWATPHTA